MRKIYVVFVKFLIDLYILRISEIILRYVTVYLDTCLFFFVLHDHLVFTNNKSKEQICSCTSQNLYPSSTNFKILFLKSRNFSVLTNLPRKVIIMKSINLYSLGSFKMCHLNLKTNILNYTFCEH